MKKKSNKVGFYIDNSFSMNRVSEDKISLLDYAKSNTKKILLALEPTQKVLLLTNDFEKKHQMWYSPKEAISLIDSIQPSSVNTRLSTILNKYHQAIDTTDFTTLYIFSDLQKTKEREMPLLSTKNNIKIGLLHTQGNNSNISIDSCYFMDPIRKNDEIETLYTKLTNHDSESVVTKVELVINNIQTSEYDIEIPSQSSVIEEFHYINPLSSNDIFGYIKIDDENIKFDNKLYFSYAIKEKIPTTTIYNNHVSNYLKTVFSDSLFKFTSYGINQVDYTELLKNELIVLDQLDKVPAELGRELQNYLIHGKNVFIFLNRSLDFESYNNFFKLIDGPSLLKWTNKKNKLSSINYKHSIFNHVFDTEDETIDLPTVTDYCLSVNNPKSQIRNILKFRDGSIFLAEYLHEKGSVFICFSDLSDDHNNFGKHGLFVPILYNAALLQFNKNNLYHIIQKEILISTNEFKKDDIINVKKDNNFEMIAPIINHKQKNIINFSNHIQSAGNYTLIANKKRKKGISFNYNREESKINFFNTTEIQNLFINNKCEIITLDGNIIKKNYQENQHKKRIEHFFILLTLILLIIELILLRL